MVSIQDNQDPIEFRTRPLWQTLLGTACLALSFFILVILVPQSDVLSASRLWLSVILAVWLLALSAIDMHRYLLPDLMTLPLILAGIVYSVMIESNWAASVMGAAIGYGLIAALEWYWRTFRGREGIGLGDAKLLAAIGAWCGVFVIPVVLLVASGVAIALVLMVSVVAKKDLNSTPIPFGPSLCLGFWVAWVLFG